MYHVIKIVLRDAIHNENATVAHTVFNSVLYVNYVEKTQLLCLLSRYLLIHVIIATIYSEIYAYKTLVKVCVCVSAMKGRKQTDKDSKI